MSHDRQAIADEILKAIEYGHLPTDEIERRLQRIKDEELSGSVYDEYNKTKVDICTSLLCHLYTDGQFSLDDRSDNIEQRIADRQDSYIKHKKTMTRGFIAVAAVLVLFVSLAVFDVISPIQWFSSKSINDEQQFAIQGHEIDIQTITTAIAEHSGQGELSTSNEEDVHRFIGFDPQIPHSIRDIYIADYFYVYISNHYIKICCDYKCKNSDAEQNSISLWMTFYTDMERAYLEYEQDETGEIISISNEHVYKYTNSDRINYLWTMNNVVFRLALHEPNNIEGIDFVREIITRSRKQ